MAEYQYPNDGKIHTRFSELDRCKTDAGAIRVAEMRAGVGVRRSSPEMDFGRDRHEMFAEESAKTGLTPAVFLDELGFQREVRSIEVHKATELFDGVVIHFTADAITKAGPMAVIDYKTSSTTGSSYRGSVQLKLYPLLLLPHLKGKRIEEVHYLIEQWDRERENIVGYHHIEYEVRLRELAEAKAWARDRVGRLIAADEHVAEKYAEFVEDRGDLAVEMDL